MPRPIRLHVKDAIYFVTQEGSGETVFKDQADFEKYLELLSEVKREQHFKLLSYALLPGAFHLLIQVDEQFPISGIMQRITPLYTKYYNERYARKGSLFQKRFKSIIVEKETYLARLTRYIHLAPVRAELVNSVNEAFAYPYSSCSSFADQVPSEANEFAAAGVNEFAADFGEGLEAVRVNLGDENLVYKQYLPKADDAELDYLEKKLSRGFILGSDAFAAEMKEQIKNQQEAQHEVEHEAEKENTIFHEEALMTAPALAASKSFVAGKSFVLVSFTGMIMAAALFSFLFSRFYFSHPPVKESLELQPADIETLTVTAPMKEISKRLDDLADLNGTVWEVELVSVLPDGTEERIQDRIRFIEGNVESNYFSQHGFSRSRYTVTNHGNGTVTWETMQTNPKGEVISWRGDWGGKKMEGILNYRGQDQNAQDFSFISKGMGVRNG